MTDHRIVDIKTGRPMDSAATPKSYEEVHADFCDSVKTMLALTSGALKIMIDLGTENEKLLRSVRWEDDKGCCVTIPVVLRDVRRNLEYLEGFFARKPK